MFLLFTLPLILYSICGMVILLLLLYKQKNILVFRTNFNDFCWMVVTSQLATWQNLIFATPFHTLYCISYPSHRIQHTRTQCCHIIHAVYLLIYMYSRYRKHWFLQNNTPTTYTFISLNIKPSLVRWYRNNGCIRQTKKITVHRNQCSLFRF